LVLYILIWEFKLKAKPIPTFALNQEEGSLARASPETKKYLCTSISVFYQSRGFNIIARLTKGHPEVAW